MSHLRESETGKTSFINIAMGMKFEEGIELTTSAAAYTVFKYIKECFNNNGFPEQFGTDNGTEFVNAEELFK